MPSHLPLKTTNTLLSLKEQLGDVPWADGTVVHVDEDGDLTVLLENGHLVNSYEYIIMVHRPEMVIAHVDYLRVSTDGDLRWEGDDMTTYATFTDRDEVRVERTSPGRASLLINDEPHAVICGTEAYELCRRLAETVAETMYHLGAIK
jgi:hypothetical protein